jgi:hypothetical protein
MNTIVKQVQKHVLKNIYQIPLVRDFAELEYQANLEKHAPHLPVISSSDLALVETLKETGVVTSSLEALCVPSSGQLLQAAKALMPNIPEKLSGKNNEYVIHATSEQIMKNPEIFTWGLEQRLLNIVENYIGLPVAYHGAYFRRDVANNVERKSRLWHIDKEDRKICKIVIYLNDVNDDNGPFQYIPHCLTSTVARLLKYDYDYVEDRTMQKVISPSNYKSCTGSAGTVVFAGTGSIFHRGKVPMSSDRFSIFYDYTSRKPRHPFYCKSSLPEKNLFQLATKFPEMQWQSVFWREHLD